MRIHSAVLSLTISAAAMTPATASGAEWQPYSNARYGYSVEIPPEYAPQPPPANGDGRRFTARNGDEIAVFATSLAGQAFTAEIEGRIAAAASDGWDVSYRQVGTERASYSGRRQTRIFYTRAVRLCDDSAAFASIEYDGRIRKSYDPIIRRLVATLKSSRCGNN